MRIRYAGKLWDVWLEDDGTMDTVISIQPVAKSKQNLNTSGTGNPEYYYPRQEMRFDSEYASEFRRPNGEMTMRGLRILGQEAAESYDAPEGFDD
jgi:hypothetical protein